MKTWLSYMDDNIRTSFTDCQDLGKQIYQFQGPCPHKPPFDGNANFWASGLAFYATAKLIDHHPLVAFAMSPRDILERAFLVSNDPLIAVDMVNHTYDSVQYERLAGLSNRDRVVLEHIVVLNMTHAIELILKALQAHEAKKLGGDWTFHAGHNLFNLYSALHGDLCAEIEAEFLVFADKYRDQVAKVRELLKRSSAPDQSIKEWATILNQIIDGLNAGGYTYVQKGSDSETVDLSAYGANSFGDALKQIPPIDINRYGPKSGPDPYPTQGVAIALIIGRFFYEHLFPPPPATGDSPVPPLQHWMPQL